MKTKYNQVSLFEKILIISIFIIIYMLPHQFLQEIGLPLDLIMFSIVTSFAVMYSFLRRGSISFYQLLFLFYLLIISFLQVSIRSFHLISILGLDLLLKDQTKIKNVIDKYYLIEISLLFTLIYTILYFGQSSRYLYTAVGEINQSGFALLILFLLTKEKYKTFGKILLMLGLLTFSRSYLLGLVMILLFKLFTKEQINSLRKYFDYKTLMIISITMLVFTSFLFMDRYEKGLIYDYSSGFAKFLNIFDFSNFLRFTTNTNLLVFYLNKPRYLLTGLTTQEFFKANIIAASILNIPFRYIKPHNFFFSYLQIYGIHSLVIFKYIGHLFRLGVNNNNYGEFIMIFSYMTFLGVGANRYWLYLSFFLLEYVKGGRSHEGNNILD